MKNNFSYYLNHPTFRNIGYLTLGNIIAQVISLIGALYIPKLLGPGQYGIYNTVIAYVMLFSVFTFGGLNKVIIRESARDINKMKEILEATIGFQNLFSLGASLLSLIVVLFIDYEKGTKIYIAIFSFSLLLRGTQNSLNTIYQSIENMKILSMFSIATQLVQVPLSILFLKMGYGVLSLILLQLFIQIAILILNYYNSRKYLQFNIFSKIVFVARYLKSGINFSLLEITGALSERIDLVMLSFLTTPANVGIYAFAYNIANKGLIIRSPISQSLFPYYARKMNNAPIPINILFKQTLLIIIPSILIAIFVSLFSKYLIVKFIGIEYSQSADILNVLIFFLIMNYASIPFGLALQVTNNEIKLLYLNVIRAILNITGNLLLFHYYGLIGIAYSTLLAVSFITVSQILVSRNIINNFKK